MVSTGDGLSAGAPAEGKTDEMAVDAPAAAAEAKPAAAPGGDGVRFEIRKWNVRTILPQYVLRRRDEIIHRIYIVVAAAVVLEQRRPFGFVLLQARALHL